jgi:DnaJ-domain-containing protein 1
VLAVLLVLMALPSTAAADSKGEQLRRTMADIALLNSQMEQRKAEAAGIRDALSARLGEIKTEAWREVGEKGLKTEADVLGNPRILYDLMLMADIQAYTSRYTQKIGYYRLACDRLSYLYQQADDDLKIINTLSDLKIDALISQVEKVLNGYLPDAQTIVLQPGTLAVAPPEKVWESLKKNR